MHAFVLHDFESAIVVTAIAENAYIERTARRQADGLLHGCACESVVRGFIETEHGLEEKFLALIVGGNGDDLRCDTIPLRAHRLRLALLLEKHEVHRIGTRQVNFVDNYAVGLETTDFRTKTIAG